jgi:hypothetical protein
MYGIDIRILGGVTGGDKMEEEEVETNAYRCR